MPRHTMECAMFPHEVAPFYKGRGLKHWCLGIHNGEKALSLQGGGIKSNNLLYACLA